MKSLRTRTVGLTAGCWIAKSMHAEPADGKTGSTMYLLSWVPRGVLSHGARYRLAQLFLPQALSSQVKREGRSTGEDETLGTSDWKEPREGIHTM